MGELFAAVLERGAVREAVSDRAWLQAMLDAEAALAGALADAGRIAAGDAAAIEAACRAENFDIAEIARAAAGPGNPAAPLVTALTAHVARTAPDAARHVHTGATSQDVVDTAAMLLVARSLPLVLDDLRGAADAAGRLAVEHRDTVMAGRTLLQQAVPTTFGLKAAGWMTALDAACAPLLTYAPRAQLGGAAGTLASLGAAGPTVVEMYAARLGLAAPVVPWHTDRTPVGALAGHLGVAAGAIAKIALDVVLLAQTEVAEVREAAAGGSSTMPHKQNPVAAIAARACAAQAPGLVATLLAAMAHEHERAAGPWHAESKPLTGLLVSVGSAASWLRTCLEGLRPDRERMRANLEATGGRLLAERVTSALADVLGRGAAHDAVAQAAADTGRPFAEALAAHPLLRGHLTLQDAEELLDPAGYTGIARELVERAISARKDKDAL
jgi:3-carboxy-cis,cis-muconate cycloisomerase